MEIGPPNHSLGLPLLPSSYCTVMSTTFVPAGSVSVTAVGRGPHRTIELRKGFDNRDSKGVGTIQLVTPLITKWLQPGSNFETGGVAILRLPEPQKWLALIAGLSLLGVLYRVRIWRESRIERGVQVVIGAQPEELPERPGHEE